MSKRIAILILVLASFAGWAQERNFFDTVSPKLNKFLADNPAACKVLTNALTEAFSTNSLRLFYFYSSDESRARAFHYYPQIAGLDDVFICVRENQTPLDEFIALFFETLNTRGQDRFAKLVEDAKAGTISRTDFALAFSRVEFEAVKKAQMMLAALKLGKKERTASYFYSRFANCPDGFEEFLAYEKKVSPQRDAIRDYESRYDELRAHTTNSVSQTNSIAPQNQN